MAIGHFERPFSPSVVDVKQPGFVVKAYLKICWTQSEIGVRRIYSDLVEYVSIFSKALKK